MKGHTFSLSLLITTLFLGCLGLSAQSQNHELGLRVYSLEELSFVYKKQKEENKFWRYRMIIGQLGIITSNQGASAVNISAVLTIGLEKRKSINQKLLFIHGWEPGLYLGFSQVAGGSFAASLIPTIGYVLGFQYNLNRSFYINLETIPVLSANIDAIDQTVNLDISAGFNSSSVALTLAYRFAADD